MSPMLLWETANIFFLKHLINIGTHKWRMKIQKLIGFLDKFLSQLNISFCSKKTVCDIIRKIFSTAS